MPARTKKDAAVAEDAAMEDAPVSAQVEDAPEQDVPENGTAEEEGEEEDEKEEEEVDAKRVKILPGSTDAAASFEFIEEGHTMGNALRYIIMKNPDVEFCAYTIPHPSEDKMNIRIQTYEGTAIDALKKGLADLQQVCDVVADEFVAKREQFNEDNGIDR